MPDLFPGFDSITVDAGGVGLFCRTGGSGPPLLLLHGYPQSHICWHKIAPALAKHFTVIAPDLPGYGQSSIPPLTDDHAPYSKRAMAAAFVEMAREHSLENTPRVKNRRSRSFSGRLVKLPLLCM